MHVDHAKDATSTSGIWEEAAARLKIADEAESQNRIDGIRCKEFRWGQQWDSDIANQRKIEQRPALTVNHTNVFCSRVENTLRQQRPRIKCHPAGGGATKDSAAKVQGLIRNIEDMSNAGIAYNNGVQNAIDIGFGYWRLVSEYVNPLSFDQHLLIKPIRNPFTVYMDPSAIMPDGRDMNWCLISETMTRAEYKRLYPRAANVEYQYGDSPGDQVLVWENKTHLRLAEYYRKHEVADVLLQLSDGNVKLRSELNPRNEEVAAILAAMQLQVVAERPTARCVVQWFRLNGRAVVDQRDEPAGAYHIPVVRCEGNVLDINGRVRRKGMVKDLIDPAQMFNYTETQKTERYALAPKAPWLLAEGQDDGHPEWNDANQKSYSRLVYKPVYAADGVTPLPPPNRNPPAPVEAGMAEWSSSAERNLMAVAGMAPENPEIQARVVSGNKHLQRRQGMQDLTHYQYYDNQTIAIAWTGNLILERIPAYYDTQREERILGEDGVPELITLNEKVPNEGGVGEFIRNDMKHGRYSIVMDTGPGYSTKREEAAENMMELLNTPLGEVVKETGPDIVLRNMDFHGADELADRAAVATPGGMEKIMEDMPKQAQTVIQTLQAQLKQKDEMLQQMGMELKYKQGIEQMKDQGQTQRTQMTTQAQLTIAGVKAETDDRNSERDAEGWRNENEVDALTRLEITDRNNETKMDVAEIQAASKLMDTDMKGKHSKEQAKIVKAGAKRNGKAN
jgi:hypothetical protein